jgi:trehalose 6-phosphate phosphatase
VKWLLSKDGAQQLIALKREHPLLVFDFDGTLAPMVRVPDRAHMRPKTAALLRELARRHAVAVLSGRKRADVAARLDRAAIRWVVGNHGAEWERVEPRVERRVARWREQLLPALFDGVRLEDKGVSLTLHYRGVKNPRATERRLKALARTLDGVDVKSGKRVINLMPAGSPNKGDALKRLRRLALCNAALYVGDDDTDEDAFAVRGAVSVRVGPSKRSRARWYLRRQSEIDRLLEELM